MSTQPATGGHPTATSYDGTGAGGGYDLADRFSALKRTMRRAEFHGHLETATLREAVLPQQGRRSRTSKRRTRHTTTLTAATAES